MGYLLAKTHRASPQKQVSDSPINTVVLDWQVPYIGCLQAKTLRVYPQNGLFRQPHWDILKIAIENLPHTPAL